MDLERSQLDRFLLYRIGLQNAMPNAEKGDKIKQPCGEGHSAQGEGEKPRKPQTDHIKKHRMPLDKRVADAYNKYDKCSYKSHFSYEKRGDRANETCFVG
jgi:hypothetical protein